MIHQQFTTKGLVGQERISNMTIYKVIRWILGFVLSYVIVVVLSLGFKDINFWLLIILITVYAEARAFETKYK